MNCRYKPRELSLRFAGVDGKLRTGSDEFRMTRAITKCGLKPRCFALQLTDRMTLNICPPLGGKWQSSFQQVADPCFFDVMGGT